MNRLITVIVGFALSSVLNPTLQASENQTSRYSPQLSLKGLEKVELPDVTIESARHFKAGDNHAETSHVQVLGVIGGTIRFELLLPDEWNERFVMGGGGLFVGTIHNQARSSVNDGCATVGTDTGHKSESVFLAGWAHLDLESQLNFGYLAVHRTAEVSRALIRLYYDRDARYSYFIGCSTGGRQGLMESQRYPNDFDGIVSGCPVASKTGLYATFIGYVQTFFPPSRPTDEPLLTEEQVKSFHEQVMIQCDGNDGLNEGIISHPIACKLRWDQINGLTREQIEALKSVYEGPKAGGKSLYPGLPLGSELRWYHWAVRPYADVVANNESVSALGFACTEFGRYFVFDDPKWTPSHYDLAKWPTDTHRVSRIVDCVDADLGSFCESSGKLIIWHSWCDGALTAKASIEYFEKVSNPAKNEFLRLYLLPGVYHCRGDPGPGPSEIDWLEVISDWVERNQTPHRLVVKKRNDEGQVVMTRPIYPYPIYAMYKGAGDPKDAGSFEPVEARPADARKQPE